MENTQPSWQKMRTTVIQWGDPVQVRSLNSKEREWKEYATKPDDAAAVERHIRDWLASHAGEDEALFR